MSNFRSQTLATALIASVQQLACEDVLLATPSCNPDLQVWEAWRQEKPGNGVWAGRGLWECAVEENASCAGVFQPNIGWTGG
eukprot:111565-Chlamydomonas_euryale.AAC.2